MELGEYPFSEGLFDSFEVYLQEPGKYAVFPVPICQDSVKVRMIVERFAGCLHGEDSSEIAFVYTKDFLEGTPSSAEEDGVKLAVVLKEGSQAFRDSKDRVAMGDVLNYFTVDVFRELYSALSSA
jgi:hypothetical protein